MKNKFKAVIFDMDGTIIDTENIWQQVLTRFLVLQGITQLTPKNKRALKSVASAGFFQTAQVLKEEFKIPLATEEIVQKKLRLSENYLLHNKINFIPGFQNFHKKLRENFIKTGIATNANISTLNILIPKLNLANLFGKNIYSIELVDNKAKPDPAIFLYTAEQLDVKPEECIIFEDSLVGFKAAKSAGMRCIAIKNNTNKDVLHLANDAIEDYTQAENIIRKIISSEKIKIPQIPQTQQI